VATEKYAVYQNGNAAEIPVTKTYGRRGDIGWYRGVAVRIGDLGLIHREDAIDADGTLPVSLSLPDLDHDTSLWEGYTQHTTAVMTAMMRQKQRFEGAVVAEYGAGGGVLGLLALKLGAEKVVLIEKDGRLYRRAKKLFRQNGITDRRVDLIYDDIANAAKHPRVLSDVTVGIANLGHSWRGYKNATGKYADELAYQAIRQSPGMRTFISGGYPSGLKLFGDLNTSWIDRADTEMQQAGYALLSHGFKTVDHLDGVARFPLVGTTHCAVAVRE